MVMELLVIHVHWWQVPMEVLLDLFRVIVHLPCFLLVNNCCRVWGMVVLLLLRWEFRCPFLRGRHKLLLLQRRRQCSKKGPWMKGNASFLVLTWVCRGWPIPLVGHWPQTMKKTMTTVMMMGQCHPWIPSIVRPMPRKTKSHPHHQHHHLSIPRNHRFNLVGHLQTPPHPHHPPQPLVHPLEVRFPLEGRSQLLLHLGRHSE